MPPASPDVVKAIAPTGRLRAGLNIANTILVQTDRETGDLTGAAPDIVYELGRRLGVPVEFVAFKHARDLYEAVSADDLDVAFLASDPARANGIAFTAPYVMIEGAYLVRQESPMIHVDEVDRADVRVVVNEGSAYALHLARTLKHARTVSGDVSTFLNEDFEVLAGIRQAIAKLNNEIPATRILDGSFMKIGQAVGAPRRCGEAGITFITDFIEELKASGFVADALARSGQSRAMLAAPRPQQQA
jgi:polar amino acid transport system substrate-binding protein